jgi:hypothetical protein
MPKFQLSKNVLAIWMLFFVGAIAISVIQQLSLPESVESAHRSPGDESIGVITFLRKEPVFLDEVQSENYSSNGSQTIHFAHVNGMAHMGAWIFILDRFPVLGLLAHSATLFHHLCSLSDSYFFRIVLTENLSGWRRAASCRHGRLLLLRRGPQLRTCADVWGFLGEHAQAEESQSALVQRAIHEEVSSFSTVLKDPHEYPIETTKPSTYR